MFYIEDNNKIVLFDEDKQKLKDTIACMPQYKNLDIQETDKNIIRFNGELVFEEDVQNELAEKRKQTFLQDFFKIQYNEQDLYFRKQPKGYSSAVESINGNRRNKRFSFRLIANDFNGCTNGATCNNHYIQ